MKNSYKLLLFIIGLLIMSSIACIVSIFCISKVCDINNPCHSSNCSHHSEDDGVDKCALLCKELGLNEDESKLIEGIKQNFSKEKERLKIIFQEKQDKLVNILKDNDELSEAVSVAVNEIHHVHGDLQRLSIQQYYEMLHVLPDDKKVILRKLALESLSKPE